MRSQALVTSAWMEYILPVKDVSYDDRWMMMMMMTTIIMMMLRSFFIHTSSIMFASSYYIRYEFLVSSLYNRPLVRTAHRRQHLDFSEGVDLLVVEGEMMMMMITLSL